MLGGRAAFTASDLPKSQARALPWDSSLPLTMQPAIDSDNGARWPHVRGGNRKQPDSGADVEEACDVREIGVAAGDERGHHPGAATPAVEDVRVGEAPTGLASGEVDDVGRLAQVHLDDAE